jgi:predicted component of viral defense system (DUF524 family)
MLEPTFGVAGSPHRSITFPQRPDVVLAVRSTTGRERLYIFDPKYKLDSEYRNPSSDEPLDGNEVHPHQRSRPVKADIDKMHAYRDSIRDQKGERVTRYAQATGRAAVATTAV